MSTKIRAALMIAAALSALVTTSSGVAEERRAAKPEQSKKSSLQQQQEEVSDRATDRVALDAQNEAIKRMEVLVKKFKGQSREQELLFRLAETYQQRSSVLFRLAHAEAAEKKTEAKLRAYEDSLKASIASLDTLIQKYPDFPEITRAYLMRAKGYDEVRAKELAKRDFLEVIKRWPESDECAAACMVVAGYETDANNYQTAVKYLRMVEERPESLQFPFALQKLALAKINLNEYRTALSYLEKHVAYYDILRKREDYFSPSDDAIRENSLLDMSLFYQEGFEKKAATFGIDEAMDYFRRYQKEPAFGKMVLRFGKLLKAHRMDDALVVWKDKLVNIFPALKQTPEAVLLVFENQVNIKQYDKLKGTVDDLVKLHRINKGCLAEAEVCRKSENMIIDTANKFRDRALAAKDKLNINYYSDLLASLYMGFTELVDPVDPRVPGVHFNLAETLFTVKRFREAAEHYRWVVDHWRKEHKGIDKRAAALRSISSLYEVLSADKMVPKDLKATMLKNDNPEAKLPEPLSRWLGWVDSYADNYRKLTEPAEDVKAFDSFAFEASRSLYASGRIREAIKRMLEFTDRKPKSPLALGAASLILDTYINSENWKDTKELAEQLLKTENWGDKQKESTEFKDRLFKVAADSFTKLIEAARSKNDFSEVTDLAKDFSKRYQKSERYVDVLLFAAEAAEKLGKNQVADKHYAEIVAKYGEHRNAGPALIGRALGRELRLEYALAAADYEAYITFAASQPGKVQIKDADLQALRSKAFWLYRVSGDEAMIGKALSSKNICQAKIGEKLAQECELARILVDLKAKREDIRKAAQKKSQDKDGDFRAAWAAIALDLPDKKLQPYERVNMIRVLASKWEDLSGEMQLELLPSVLRSVPAALELNRQAIAAQRLRPSEDSIGGRVRFVQETEGAAGKAVKMPFAEIRAASLVQVAGLYADLAKNLGEIPAPKNLPEKELEQYQDMIKKLVLPFEEKGQDIAFKAFEVASKASIKRDQFHNLADWFFENNPSLGASLRPPLAIPAPSALGLDVLMLVDPDGDWDDARDNVDPYDIPNNPKKKISYLRAKWVKALEQKKFSLMNHYLGMLKEAGALPPGGFQVMAALALNAAGAEAQAFAEIDAARDEFKKKPKVWNGLTVLLVKRYLASYAKEKTKSLIEELNSKNAEGTITSAGHGDMDYFSIAYGAEWAGAELPKTTRIELLSRASKVNVKEYREWAGTKLKELAPKPVPAASPSAAEKKRT